MKSEANRHGTGNPSPAPHARELLFGDLWDYAPAPGSSPAPVRSHYGHFVGGKFVDGDAHTTTVNPATGERLARVAVADRRLVGRAVRAAATAFERRWSGLPGIERGKWLYRLSRRLQESTDELAHVQCVDGGQPLRDVRDEELPLAVAHGMYHAGWADKLDQVSPPHAARPAAGPHGVVAALLSGPAAVIEAMRAIAPALAAGNTVVMVPTSAAPLAALRLGEVARDADLPSGVINVVTGGPDIALEVAAHSGIDLVTASGPPGIGLALRQKLAGSSKPCLFDPTCPMLNLVFQDADLDAATEGVVSALRQAHGPGVRLLVQESVHDALVGRLTRRLSTLRTGDPLDLNTDVGAIPTREQHDRLLAWLASAEAEGAIRHQPPGPMPDQGWFLPPTVLTGVTENHGAVRQAAPGPVLTVLTFRTSAEAIALAHGLSGLTHVGVWSDRGARVLDVGRGLRAGVIWSNTAPRRDPSSPTDATWAGGGSPVGGWSGLRPYLKGVS